MSNQVNQAKPFMKLSFLIACLSVALVSSCAVSAKTEDKAAVTENPAKQEKISTVSTETKNSLGKGRIKVAPDSPADKIRVFYKNLREKRIREAIMMTNLRPAVEGLSDAEVADLHSDFDPISNAVPADLQISGEVVMGNKATVMVKMPDDETGVLVDKVHTLQRDKDSWIYLMADEAAEKAAKKEGKNYFFELRLDVHHSEAQNMMERIAKSQMVYAMQNAGLYGDMQALIKENLLPADAQNAQSTGYRYNVFPSADKKKYIATAEPAVYGKTGKLSFLLEFTGKSPQAQLKFEDKKGASLKK